MRSLGRLQFCLDRIQLGLDGANLVAFGVDHGVVKCKAGLELVNLSLCRCEALLKAVCLLATLTQLVTENLHVL